MDMIDISEFKSLLQEQKWPAVSLYMPVSRIGDQQDSIRYKNFITQIETRLIDGGMRSAEARSFLDPEYKLVQNQGYWKHIGREGLAVFRAGDVALRYHLPISFQELIQVGHRFHVKPLVPFLENQPYLVVTLNKNGIHLYQGDRFEIREIELPPDTPRNMGEVLRYDDPESQLTYHTQSGSYGEGSRPMYHGQGVGIDEEKVNLERYFQAVDRGLFPLLDQKNCPIILAGIDELAAIYRHTTKSNAVLKEVVGKNPDDLSIEELHQKTWKIVANYYARGEDNALTELGNNLGTGRVSDDLQNVLIAASEGRVDTLFVVQNEQVWGTFDHDERKMVQTNEMNSGSVDLLDEAVFWTMLKRGRIYFKERKDMPQDSAVCALLRY
ncbi:baeRF7 domain-containing protein [Desulfopila inferna]|uniref:baeRF7 domain-containing protein n=1 Tax=Desulfopila inferna TaxID=468528 RepID=UPI001963727D|nr:hypothetical protein [Desulfopila inferna]MBM9605380.1 hypothetical protein [Desulfopila inferna]